MLQVVVMMLTSAAIVLGTSNSSSVRLGKMRLLKELRSRTAFTDTLAPGGDNNIVNITFIYRHYEALLVDEVELSVTSVGYVNVTWEDPDLAWNKSDFGGVDLIKVQYNEIWHPTIIVTNSVDPEFLRIDKIDTLRIMSNGSISYVTPVYLKTTCNMDLKDYPFDIQECPIIFVPFLDDVQYAIFTEDRDRPRKHGSITGEWRMLSSDISAHLVTYLGGTSHIIKAPLTVKQ